MLARNVTHQHTGQFLLFPRWTATRWNLLKPLIALFTMFHPISIVVWNLLSRLKVCNMSISLYSLTRLTLTKRVRKIFVKCADIWPRFFLFIFLNIFEFSWLTQPTWLKLHTRILFSSLYSVRNYSHDYL